MHKTFRAGALVVLAVLSLLALSTTGVSAQAAANGCPPGQPPGRPAGTPPGNPPVQTGRPNYPPGRCQLALSQSAGQRGETFQATGNGFVPGETVSLRMAGRTIGSAVVDANGRFSASATVPGDAHIGRTEVLASGASQELAAGFDVLPSAATRTAPADRSGSSLPRTGVEIAALTGLGAVLLGLGTVLVLAIRRRQQPVA